MVLSRAITTTLQPYASTYSLLDGCACIPAKADDLKRYLVMFIESDA